MSSFSKLKFLMTNEDDTSYRRRAVRLSGETYGSILGSAVASGYDTGIPRRVQQC